VRATRYDKLASYFWPFVAITTSVFGVALPKIDSKFNAFPPAFRANDVFAPRRCQAEAGGQRPPEPAPDRVRGRLYEKPKSLPKAQRFLKPGAAFEQLDAIAQEYSDNETVRRLNPSSGNLVSTHQQFPTQPMPHGLGRLSPLSSRPLQAHFWIGKDYRMSNAAHPSR
jgi:hypothetical protein